MLKCSRYLNAVLIGILFFGNAGAAPVPAVTSTDAPQNILFVGNSFTYYNNSLHNHVKNMMREGGKDVGTIRSMTISGAALAQHAPAMPGQIHAVKWDIVILQGNSLEPIEKDSVEGFRDAVRRYSKAITESGAQTVLFMTWARTHLPEQTAALDEAYTSIGNETGSYVVPVALAFELSTLQENGISLRMPDRRHPTLEGTYLAACTFYAALFDESPLGNAFNAGLENDVAETLQRVAWEAVQNYYSGAD